MGEPTVFIPFEEDTAMSDNRIIEPVYRIIEQPSIYDK
jgi:hypothetical protein